VVEDQCLQDQVVVAAEQAPHHHHHRHHHLDQQKGIHLVQQVVDLEYLDHLLVEELDHLMLLLRELLQEDKQVVELEAISIPVVDMEVVIQMDILIEVDMVVRSVVSASLSYVREICVK
jgi:surfactin synthase thioesterase subunit